MSAEAESWYRTGAAAKLLETSPYRVRELARAGLLQSELRNGYRYIAGREVERLKRDGLPPLPASAEIAVAHGDEPQAPDSGARPIRGRLAQELYAEPSRQLAKSKEAVLRLEHAAEAKRLRKEMREIDRVAREQQDRIREAQFIEDWRDAAIRRAVESVPAEVCSDVCSKVNGLLDSVPDCTNVTGKVDEITQAALRPIHQREQQARAAEEHRRRVARTVESVSLPYGATGDDREEAQELALSALAALPAGASDRQFRATLGRAILPVLSRISRHHADEERAKLEANHKRRIEQMVAWCQPYRATGQEGDDAKRRVRAALERLPATATHDDISRARDEAVAPIKSAIQQREQTQRDEERARHNAFLDRLFPTHRVDSLLACNLESCLRRLEKNGDVSFDSDFDRNEIRDKLATKIRPILIARITQNPEMTNARIVERIGELVERYYEDFCDG